jgi:hypothetical protein
MRTGCASVLRSYLRGRADGGGLLPGVDALLPAVGVRGPESFDAVPFLALLNDYGSPWAMREEAAPADALP